MSCGKVCFIVVVSMLLIVDATSVLAGKSWKKWESLRWSGLQQFSKGHIEVAQKSFEQALTEAQRVESRGINEVISMILPKFMMPKIGVDRLRNIVYAL